MTAPLGGRNGGRIHLSGLPVRLQPRAALAFAMGLHELATNVLKYGALSSAAHEGWVDLGWTKSGGQMCFVWYKYGGPSVTQLSRHGFGTRLVERSLAQDLGGTVKLAFDPEGVACTVNAPLTEVAAPAESPVFLRVTGGVGH